MKLSNSELRYNRFKKSILIIGLVAFSIMAGRMLKEKDESASLKKRTKRQQIFPQRAPTMNSNTEPLTPLLANHLKSVSEFKSVAEFGFSLDKKHTCGGRRRRCGRRHGSFGRRRAKCAGFGHRGGGGGIGLFGGRRRGCFGLFCGRGRGGGAVRGGGIGLFGGGFKRRRWGRTWRYGKYGGCSGIRRGAGGVIIQPEDHGNFIFNGITYYYVDAAKKDCYYFDPAGRRHFGSVAEIQAFTVPVVIGGVKYTCKQKGPLGEQRCFIQGTDMKKRYIWMKDVKPPERKVIMLGNVQQEAFVADKKTFIMYIVQNGQKVYLPRAQTKFILSDDPEKTFEANGLTYYYLDARKTRCWAIVNGERQEYWVKTVKDYGTFKGIDGLTYYFMDKEKTKAFFLNPQGERQYVVAKTMFNWGSFMHNGERFYFEDASRTKCFKIVNGVRQTAVIQKLTDFGKFTGNDGKIYFFADAKHERAYTIEETTKKVIFVNVAEVKVKEIKKVPSLFFFFVKNDMYYYDMKDRTKCMKAGTTTVVKVEETWKVEDGDFAPTDFILIGEDKKEVKYRFEDLSRKRCFIFIEGEASKELVNFDDLKGEKYFIWAQKKWFLKTPTH